MTDTEDTGTAPTARPAKIRTSITIRPDFLAQAKEEGPSVSAVIDAALKLHFDGNACQDTSNG